MADQHLIDPRVDATATVLWKRLKDIDLATPAEQVIMHNLAELMKGQQRLTERVEKLANTVEKLANSQKLNKTRRFSEASAASSHPGDDETDPDPAFSVSDASKALQNLLREHQDILSDLYDNFVTVGNKKIYQMRHSNAAADAKEFVKQCINQLDVNNEDTGVDEVSATEISAMLKELTEDLSRDLYAKMGKAKMANSKSKGKGAESGSADEDTGSVGKSRGRKRKAHRPNLEAVREEDEHEEDEEEEDVMSSHNRKRRRLSQGRSIVESDPEEADDVVPGAQGE